MNMQPTARTCQPRKHSTTAMAMVQPLSAELRGGVRFIGPRTGARQRQHTSAFSASAAPQFRQGPSQRQQRVSSRPQGAPQAGQIGIVVIPAIYRPRPRCTTSIGAAHTSVTSRIVSTPWAWLSRSTVPFATPLRTSLM